MCTRALKQNAAPWEALDGLPTPSRASPTGSGALVLMNSTSSASASRASASATSGSLTEAEALKDKVRIEQELESDRRFFADPPDDFVRCPTCNIVYAVHTSRPTTPSDLAAVIGATGGASLVPLTIPACYSKEMPRGSNLNLEEATRHMHRSRFRCSQCDTDFCRCGMAPYHWGWSCDGWQKHRQLRITEVCPVGSCRWCSKPCMDKLRRSESLATSCCGDDEGNELQRFPPVLSCAEKERRACGKRHPDCGHLCGGVRGESRCLPCLQPECIRARQAAVARGVFSIAAVNGCGAGEGKALGSTALATPAPQASLLKLPEADEWCPICWTEPLSAAPSVRLCCGHVMHHHCVEALVRRGHTAGRRLTFKSIRCPLCQAVTQHSTIDSLVAPQLAMYQKVRRKALQRWLVEQRRPAPRSHDPADEERIAGLAMTKMAFFECSQCNEPYYGGELECAEAAEEDEELDEDVQAALAMELVCRGCASKGQLQCPEHGTEFLGWKCRYCCEREAHYFCFGTTHFCYVCHDQWQTGVEQRRKLQAGKPCLGKDRCIFGGCHPPGSRNGRDEYALGCTICAQDTECGILVNRERRAARRKMSKNCAVM
eukprot:TRINITY_DN10006_c0_g2_i1.p1 TRINITY_DN10006_c0_g2~~TRINITY_DN10006_c0_g2_i1.p1  ORF type:complete len:602 (-),score=133.13 TRINITY_DN10006_c0_g2_i1:95-1900(-)